MGPARTSSRPPGSANTDHRRAAYFPRLAAVLLILCAGAGAGAKPAKIDEAARRADLRLQAIALEHGEGVTRDQLKAAAMYCEAARLGDAEALYNLGWMYANGRGVDRDDELAAYFFHAAAEQGFDHASDMLARVGDPPKKIPDCMRAPVPAIVAKGAPAAVMAKAPKPAGELRPLHVLLIAGPKDHGKGEHDYPVWQKEWAPLLGKAKNVKVSTAWKWPEASQWEGVDLAVCYFKSPWTAEQIADVERLHQRGGGLVTIHWAISPDKEFEKHQNVVGITYKGAKYRHGWVDLKLTAEHPILAGLPRVMRFYDEPYWPLIGDQNRVKTLATSDELLKETDKAPSPVPVFWTFDPHAKKGRTFVSIFGHYMWTFEDPYFRLMLLRGMAWAAGENGEAVYRFDPLAVEGVKLAE